MKLKWPLGLLILLFLIGTFIYYGWFYEERLLYKAIPNDAVMIMELQNLDSLQTALHQNIVWEDLQQIDWVNKVDKTYSVLDSIFLKDRQAVRETVLSSLHVTKHDDYEILLVVDKALLQAPLDLMIRQLETDRQAYKVYSRTVRGATVFELEHPQLGKRFSFATKGENFIASFSSHLVDESLVDYQEGTSRYWNMTKRISPHTDACFYFNFPKFPLLKSLFFNKEPNNLFHLLSEQVKWMRWEMNFHKGGIGFGGNALLNQENQLYNWVLRQEGNGAMTIPKILPSNTAFLAHCNINDYKEIHDQLDNKWAEAFGTYGVDWIGKEWAFGLTEPTSGDAFLESFVVLDVHDVERASDVVAKLTTVNGPVHAPKKYHSYQVIHGDASIIVGHLFGELAGSHYKDAYYTFIDHYLLLASTEHHLTVLIKKYLAQKTLDRFEDFTDYVTSRDSSTNILCYANIGLMQQLLIRNASTAFGEDLRLNFDSYKKISPFVCQLKKERRDVVTDGLIGYAESEEVLKTLLWSKPLGDKIMMSPQVITNYRTQEKEIIVQDQSNMLYLLSKNGNVIWQRDIKAPILGKIHQVDFHNNGQLQFLFNTESSIFLLNHEGGDEYGFPNGLARKAITGLSIARTSNRRVNYDYFIPCVGKELYGYQYTGVPLDRWRPKYKLSTVKQPILYFEHEGKGRIVVINEKGNVIFLDREGKEKARAYIGHKIVGTPQIDRRNGEPVVVLLAQNGKTYFVDRFGEKWSKKLTPRSEYMQFLSDNILGDANQEELIYIADNQIFICNERERIANTILPDGAIPHQIFAVDNITDKEVKRVGVFCENSEQIFLLDKYGNIDEDFPLPATTPFVITDLLGSGQNILIAGGKDNNVFAYKLK